MTRFPTRMRRILRDTLWLAFVVVSGVLALTWWYFPLLTLAGVLLAIVFLVIVLPSLGPSPAHARTHARSDRKEEQP